MQRHGQATPLLYSASLFKLIWQEIQLEQYDQVFQEGLSTLRGYEAKIEVDPNAQPKYNKASEVRRGRLVAEGTLESVDYFDWAVP